MYVNKGKLIILLEIILLIPIMIYPFSNSGSLLLLSQLICLILEFHLLISKQIIKIADNLTKLWMITIFPVIINSFSLKKHQYSFLFLWGCCLLLLVTVCQFQNVKFDVVIKFIGLASCIYIFSTILFNLDINNTLLLRIAKIFRSNVSIATLKTAGLTDHYSHNSMYIALGVIIWFSFAINERQKKRYLVILIASIIAMLWTQKRGPLIAISVAMIITYYKRGKITIHKGKMLTKLLVGGAILLFFIYIASHFFPSLFSVFNRFSNSDNLLTNRQYLWNFAICLFKKSPLIGHGWGYYANNLKLTIDTIDVKAMNAHNIYLQLLADVGIIGFCIFIIPMIMSLLICIRIINQKQTKDCIVMSFSMCMQLFFIIYGLSGNPLYDKQMCLPYMIAVAITIYYYYGEIRK